MGENKTGSLVVTRKGNAWGLVTDKDLINVLAAGNDLADVRIKDAMSTPLISITTKATITEAAERMARRGGGLVVFEGETLVGIITASDIIKSLPECSETCLNIDDFMSQELVSLDESASAIEAIKLMSEKCQKNNRQSSRHRVNQFYQYKKSLRRILPFHPHFHFIVNP